MAVGNERGGRKPNAGRKPGRDYRGMLPEATGASESPAASTTLVLDATTAPLITAARLRATGVSLREIAKRLGRDWETVKRYLDSPDGRIALQDAVNAYTPPDIFSGMVPYAAEAYYDALEDRDEPQIRATMARDVMDRQFGKSVIRSEHTGTPTPNILIISQTINNQVSATPPEPPLAIEGDFLLLPL